MKRLIIIIFLIATAFTSYAQAPQTISYQAVVRSSNGELLTDKRISMRASIIHGSTEGTSVYSEIHRPVTNANGIVYVEIGAGESDFSQIDWSAGQYFLKTEIDINGGENYSVVTVDQIHAVPYAYYADKAGNVPDLSGFITEETDPTVSSWAKADTKPVYDYSEIANTPEIPTIPTNVSAFANDANYITLSDIPAQENADWNATSGPAQILNKPTAVSAFTNDIGYLTSYTETQTLANMATRGNSVNAQLKDVTNPTDTQDALTKSYTDAYASQIESVQASHGAIIDEITFLGKGIIDKRDGNHYKVVKIGNQVWLAENLRYAGDIQLGTENDSSTTIPYRYYPNDDASNVATYGYLYNWPATMNGENGSDAVPSGVRGICPYGWHLPSDNEWTILFEELMDDDSGYSNIPPMLSGHAELWGDGPLTQAEHFGETGFNAVPAGGFYKSNYEGTASFRYFGIRTYYWSSYEYSATNGDAFYFIIDDTSVHYVSERKAFGTSIRCLKDY